MTIHEQFHTCFKCGSRFDIDEAEFCANCGWKTCPSCQSCYCTLGLEAQLAVDAIYDTYCNYCNPCKQTSGGTLPNMYRVYRYIERGDAKALSDYLSGIADRDMDSYATGLVKKGRENVTKKEIQQKLSSLGVRYW